MKFKIELGIWYGRPCIKILILPNYNTPTSENFSILAQSSECTANGQKCIFPFIYKGETYNSCTKVDSYLAWCALELNPNGNGEVIPGKWADCDPNCSVEKNGK